LTRRRRPAQELRVAIEWLPIDTKRAMLDAIEHNRIIVGAYTDRQGGVCPMLAAHRNGGRTSYASFARAWDRYTNASSRSRPASERELTTLRTMLEASLASDAPDGTTLGMAIAEHRELQDRAPKRHITDTGERNRMPELRKRHGWAWTRLFRRIEDYEAAIAQLEEDSGSGVDVARPDELDLRHHAIR
jgi:hypothetical protein